MSDLKPCPFCGGDASQTGSLVMCQSCGANVDGTTEPGADAWNRRVDDEDDPDEEA